MTSLDRSVTAAAPRLSRRHLAAMLALGWALGGCGGGGEGAPFFKNAFADKPVVQTVPMVHGFTVLLVDEVASREQSTFTLRFKAAEALDFTVTNGNYQDGLLPPRVELNGSPAEMQGMLNGQAKEATFKLEVSKVAGRETTSSHQVRFELFGNGPLDSTAVTPVELEIGGPAGARWEVLEHQGPAKKAP